MTDTCKTPVCLTGHIPTEKEPYILLKDSEGYFFYNAHPHPTVFLSNDNKLRCDYYTHINPEYTEEEIQMFEKYTFEQCSSQLRHQQLAYRSQWSKIVEKNYTLPAGSYYIGDPCYVIKSRWHEINDMFDKSIHTDNPCLFEVDNHSVFMAFTAYGDGGYLGTNGMEYSVDSGLIGIVPEILKEEFNSRLTTHIISSTPISIKHYNGDTFEFSYEDQKIVICTNFEEE